MMLMAKRWVFTQSEMVNCRSVLEETVNNYQQNALHQNVYWDRMTPFSVDFKQFRVLQRKNTKHILH